MARFFFFIILFCEISFIGNGQSVYQLKKVDYALIPMAIASELVALQVEDNQHKLTYNDLISLNKNTINSFDRSATRYWDPDLDKVSDLATYAILASPTTILLSQALKKDWSTALTYGLMYIETLALTAGIKDLTKVLSERTRPYLYNPGIRMDEKATFVDDHKAIDSFFSGHTAGAFSTAVFLSVTYSSIYGNGTTSKIIWGTSLSAACAVGYLRYRSGKHFPTDIITGAIVGSGIGYLVPFLHKIRPVDNKISYVITPGKLGIICHL